MGHGERQRLGSALRVVRRLRAVLLIQRTWRQHYSTKEAIALRKNRYRVVRQRNIRRHAATMIQAVVRGFLTRHGKLHRLIVTKKNAVECLRAWMLAKISGRLLEIRRFARYRDRCCRRIQAVWMRQRHVHAQNHTISKMQRVVSRSNRRIVVDAEAAERIALGFDEASEREIAVTTFSSKFEAMRQTWAIVLQEWTKRFPIENQVSAATIIQSSVRASAVRKRLKQATDNAEARTATLAGGFKYLRSLGDSGRNSRTSLSTSFLARSGASTTLSDGPTLRLIMQQQQARRSIILMYDVTRAELASEFARGLEVRFFRRPTKLLDVLDAESSIMADSLSLSAEYFARPHDYPVSPPPLLLRPLRRSTEGRRLTCPLEAYDTDVDAERGAVRLLRQYAMCRLNDVPKDNQDGVDPDNASRGTVDMSHRSLTVAEVQPLLWSVSTNTYCVTLDLSGNCLRDDACAPLAQLIEECLALEVLLLCDNPITDVGATLLRRSVRKSKKLTILDLGGTCVTLCMRQAIAEDLRSHRLGAPLRGAEARPKVSGVRSLARWSEMPVEKYVPKPLVIDSPKEFY